MFAFLKRIFKPKYNTLNEIEINRIKIISNFNYLKRLQPNAEIFPVLKSNAYGHGLREMCHILNSNLLFFKDQKFYFFSYFLSFNF